MAEMPELLVLSKRADEYCALLQVAKLPNLEIKTALSPKVEIVFGEPDLICEALDSLPALVWAQSTWAGVEPLLDPNLRRDYILTNARGVFGPLMSEFVFGYLLLHERKILQRLDAQRQHRWNPSLTGTLRGKTLGLLGVGSIGAHLASTAKHFGLHVRGFTRSSEDCTDVDTYFHANLPAFASGLDYLVSLLPNTAETKQIIDADLLQALPAHAILINAGRGSAVNELALVEALEAGRLALAVLDVFEREPLPTEHIFWRTRNLLITSHTAAPSFPIDILRLFIENYHLYLDHEPLMYRVDFERGY
jgi:phosphoglycerate dehydrogenase-like enzyme